MIATTILALVTAGLASATTFRGVPPDCRAELEVIPEAARTSDVDWRALLRHLLSTNVLKRGEPLTPRWFAWHTPRARVRIGEALGNPRWEWTDGLDERASHAIGRHQNFAPRQLAFLTAVRGFDARTAMRAYLSEGRSRATAVHYHDVMASAPLWLAGADAYEMAEAFWASSNRTRWSRLVEVVAGRLGSADRARFVRRVLKDIADFGPRDTEDTVTLLRSLPHHRDAADLVRGRRPRRRDWIDTTRFAPVRVPGVRLVQSNTIGAGKCYAMTRGHLSTLLDPGANHPVLVFVGDVLIGFVKTAGQGDPSLLALRNVEDAAGRPVMAMGGAYRVSNDFPLQSAGLTSREGILRVRVDTLGVSPLDFVANRFAWIERPTRWCEPLIAKLALPHVSPSRRDAAGAALAPGRPTPDAEVSRWLWCALLDRMVAFRVEMETLR